MHGRLLLSCSLECLCCVDAFVIHLRIAAVTLAALDPQS